ncbi:cardiolipin synthase [Maribacter sp. 2307ULW6-5]|uniref:cardiolipin synthase n=1 Tax=Maribacter sp. 2307ULW6-5 TaxID=3386275 RepID=UPI0039BCB85E
MSGLVIAQIMYVIVLFLVILRVLYDTRSETKALAYILFIVFVPLIGMGFYFAFGTNYRKRKLYSKKLIQDDDLRQVLRQGVRSYSRKVLEKTGLEDRHGNLIRFIHHAAKSPLTANNGVRLLINGEEKFPEVLRALRAAKHHIHMEYYIYEDDATGEEIAGVLMEKARQGVAVRFLYDDFGSNALGKRFLQRLEEAGVQTAPFYKINILALANRINYRNHRKIIVIDGRTSFVGGINMSDRYRNDALAKDSLFWRDTHLRLDGVASYYLQYVFLCDWNFCSQHKAGYSTHLFPPRDKTLPIAGEVVQMVASGPDSELPTILYSLLEAVGNAKKSILITSPYFIPGESLMDALIIAAEAGVHIQILVPGTSDSRLVNAAAQAYYTELLRHGVAIYRYNKGFVHAKTMVVDDDLAIVGTANMDYRSFDLNFEVNAIIYGKRLAAELGQAFSNDLENATKMDAEAWLARPKYLHIWERLVRLTSPFL